MAGFGDLASEIVLHIWKLVRDPRDIENFALTSKDVHEAGEEFIKHHHQLRTRYSNIDDDHDEDFEYNPRIKRGSGLAALLRDFILHPEHALYVTRARLGDLRKRWQSSQTLQAGDLDVDKIPKQHRPYHQADMDLFIQAVKDSEFVLTKDEPKWIRALESGQEDPIVALLLTKTLALKKLEFDTECDTSGLLCQMIKRIASSSSPACLSKLKEVCVGCSYVNDAQAFELVNVIGELPSIISMRIANLNMRATRYGIPGFNAIPMNSNIECLRFELCYLDVEILVDSLQGLSSLKSLEFSDVEEPGDDDVLNLFHIRATLLAHASRSLESLVFTTNCFEYSPGPYMGSIHGMVALKSLQINCQSLLGRQSDGKAYSSSLADALPNAIEVVEVQDYIPGLETIPMVQEVIACKNDERFPCLRYLCLIIPSKDPAQLHTDMAGLQTLRQREKVGLKEIQDVCKQLMNEAQAKGMTLCIRGRDEGGRFVRGWSYL